MVKITFKYVGQGDGVIVEWGVENKGVGIIDCHKYNGNNTILDHISSLKPSQIDFIILSHPHYDHYHGLNEILEYCDESNVSIKLFGFTTDIDRNYLESILMPNEDKKELANLFRYANKLESKGIIKKRGLLNDLSGKLDLYDDVFLRFLSPSQIEKDEFYKTLFNDDMQIRNQANPNLLSIVTSIESDENQILLTADTEKSTLRRLGIKVLKRFDKKLKLGQVPHHGSEENHDKEFWKRRIHDPKTNLAISVGPNGHGHPSDKVISELENLDYEVELTAPSLRNKSSSNSGLNLISKKSRQNVKTQDLEYKIKL